MSWEQSGQTEWNADDEACRMIFALKAEFVNLAQDIKDEYDIERLYNLLLTFWGEAKAALDIHEREEYDGKIEDLEVIRANCLADGHWSDEEISKFNKALRTFYEEVCISLTEHGVYFRKRPDPRKAALRK